MVILMLLRCRLRCIRVLLLMLFVVIRVTVPVRLIRLRRVILVRRRWRSVLTWIRVRARLVLWRIGLVLRRMSLLRVIGVLLRL